MFKKKRKNSTLEESPFLEGGETTNYSGNDTVNPKKRRSSFSCNDVFFVSLAPSIEQEAAAREACRILFVKQIANKRFPSHQAAHFKISKILASSVSDVSNMGIIRYCSEAKYHLAVTYVDFRGKIRSVDLTPMLETFHKEIKEREDMNDELKIFINQYLRSKYGIQLILYNNISTSPGCNGSDLFLQSPVF